MKIDLQKDGLMTITTETGIEEYAVESWFKVFNSGDAAICFASEVSRRSIGHMIRRQPAQKHQRKSST